MKNIGKIFEKNFKDSIPKNIWCYKPPDAAQAFNMDNTKLRFSAHSPCDYMLFNGRLLCFFELKTFDGACSFERSKEEHGNIHHHQIVTLKKYSGYRNTVAGFILDFRKTGNTYFLGIKDFDVLTEKITKKSFNEKDIMNYCNPVEIEKQKLKVNYRYNIKKLLNDIEKGRTEYDD